MTGGDVWEALLAAITSPGASAVAGAALKGAGSAVGGLAAKAGVGRAVSSAEARAQSIVTLKALARAASDAVEVAPESWEEWWRGPGDRLLRIIGEPKVASLLAGAALPGGQDLTLDALRRVLSGDAARDLDNLDGLEGIDLQQLLTLLPGTLTDELAWAAVQLDSPLRDLWNAAALRIVVDAVQPRALATLSPGEVREQLTSFVHDVESWATRRLTDLPYIGTGLNIDRLDQAVQVRVGVRQNRANPEQGTSSEIGLAGRYVPLSGRAGTEREALDWDDAIRRFPRVVVLADAGLGKTWLVHSQTRRLARASQVELDSGTAASDILLPVVVRCDVLAASTMGSLTDAAIDVVANRHAVTPGLRAWLRQHAEAGQVLLLLDALDETTEHERAALGAQFDRWVESSDALTARGSLVITSRLAGYDGAPLALRCVEVELQPFLNEDIQRYIEAWDLPEPARKRLDERLNLPAVAGLARIPLLLAMLCDLSAAMEPLPTTRVGLYDRILRRFLRAEHHRAEQGTDRAKGLWEPGRQSEQRLLPVLASVAAHFANTPAGWVDRMPSGQVLDALRAAPTFGEFHADAPEVLDRLSGGAGILIPAGDSRRGEDPPYLFLHRTFAEYLTATHLARGDWRTAVTDHMWFDSEWEEVLLLLGGVLTHPEDLLGLLLQQQSDPLHHGLMTCARVIAELDPKSSDRVEALAMLATTRLRSLVSTPASGPATMALGAIAQRSPSAFTTLITLASDADPSIRKQAASALAQRPGDQATAALLTLARDAVPSTRQGAVSALMKRPGDQATAALLTLARDTDPMVQDTATWALAHRPGDQAAAALLTLIRDTDPSIRRNAAGALGGFRTDELYGWSDDRSTAALLTLARDVDPSVRGRAAFALRFLPGDQVTAALLTLARDADLIVQRSAVGALRERPGDDVTEVLLTLTRNADPFFQEVVAAVLGERPSDEVTAALLTQAHDTDTSARAGAAWGLGRRPGSEVTAALLTLARDTDPNVRQGAAWGLGRRPGSEVTAALLTLAGDADPDVRQGAASELRGRPGDRVTAALLTLAGDADHSVRRGAASGLGKRPGDEANAELLALTDDADHSVRFNAARALAGRGAPVLAASIRAIARGGTDRQAGHLYDECRDFVRGDSWSAADRTSILEAIGELTARVAPIPRGT